MADHDEPQELTDLRAGRHELADDPVLELAAREHVVARHGAPALHVGILDQDPRRRKLLGLTGFHDSLGGVLPGSRDGRGTQEPSRLVAHEQRGLIQTRDQGRREQQAAQGLRITR